MLTTKGIIEAVEFDKESGVTQYRVRLPIFHEVEGASTVTTKELPLGIYALPPHMENTILRIGDVVLCSLEDGTLDNVVIIGLIPSSVIKNTAGSRETESKISVEQLDSVSFNEKGTAILPYNIKIRTDDSTEELIEGTERNYVNGEDLSYLRGLNSPLQDKLDHIEELLTYLETNLMRYEVRVTEVYSEGVQETQPQDPLTIQYHISRYNAKYNKNFTEQDLQGSQLICVQSGSGTDATLYFFKKEDDNWVLDTSINYFNGCVGRGGVGQASYDIPVTPAGYYKLCPAYGAESSPEIDMTYTQIQRGMWWVGAVDGPGTQYYNEFYDNTSGSADWLNRDTDEDLYYLMNAGYYDYMILIQYNYDENNHPHGEVFKGSAFFLHTEAQNEHYTSGCVATPQENMIKIFKWIHQDQNPHILIY